MTPVNFVPANGHWTLLLSLRLPLSTVTRSSMTPTFSGQQLLVVVAVRQETATLRGTGHVVTNWTKANHQANPIGHSQPSVNFMTPACSSVTQTMWPLTCSYCVNKGQQNCSDSVIKHIGQLNILILGPSGSRSPNTGQSTSVKFCTPVMLMS